MHAYTPTHRNTHKTIFLCTLCNIFLYIIFLIINIILKKKRKEEIYIYICIYNIIHNIYNIYIIYNNIYICTYNINLFVKSIIKCIITAMQYFYELLTLNITMDAQEKRKETKPLL